MRQKILNSLSPMFSFSFCVQERLTKKLDAWKKCVLCSLNNSNSITEKSYSTRKYPPSFSHRRRSFESAFVCVQKCVCLPLFVATFCLLFPFSFFLSQDNRRVICNTQIEHWTWCKCIKFRERRQMESYLREIFNFFVGRFDVKIDFFGEKFWSTYSVIWWLAVNIGSIFGKRLTQIHYNRHFYGCWMYSTKATVVQLRRIG